ncbi:YbhB/YbcL family Raf kinase inhibitor-like protein [Altererythrobacter confluentis]|uniref:YbhB/YbcL family Raf kinase inhibitor-like protein n=1 Tax=Allopontixanthobacter confluentis TaxID=1849021 RepID=A0A6L7GHT6_9SPHN|nr:YbhB/YbcL family Raf kinase inhibitor-like protein [Allopontixanthobacter confluentis]MXP14844.1 YbhB/YbcL family Raf kinase inhibitor-like protein [Allopontixanthobacter confluentis]
MPEHVPAWLAAALKNVRAGHGKLTVAQLASERDLGRSGFALTSPAFANGAELDPCFTAQEEDAVAPPLEWNAPPAGTQELAIIVEDADAMSGGEPLCHWLVWGLAPQKGKLLEGEAPPRVGKNARKNSEWLLPDPPLGDDAHDYVFQIFALDLPLTLMPGAGRKELVAAMQGHVIGTAVLTGTYARDEDDDDAWDEDDEDA